MSFYGTINEIVFARLIALGFIGPSWNISCSCSDSSDWLIWRIEDLFLNLFILFYFFIFSFGLIIRLCLDPLSACCTN